jgi:hypothetical protein
MKIKELNRLFIEEQARQMTGLHQKEFELVRRLKRLGVKIDGFSSKKPTVSRRRPGCCNPSHAATGEKP